MSYILFYYNNLKKSYVKCCHHNYRFKHFSQYFGLFISKLSLLVLFFIQLFVGCYSQRHSISQMHYHIHSELFVLCFTILELYFILYSSKRFKHLVQFSTNLELYFTQCYHKHLRQLIQFYQILKQSFYLLIEGQILSILQLF